jgi:CcmD family protein
MYWGYVAAGYGIVFTGILIYSLLVLRQGRSLAKRVPPARRRFLD